MRASLISLFLLGILPAGTAFSQEEVKGLSETHLEFQAFKNGLYPYVILNCKKCHGVDGKSSKPQFARSDADLSFAVASEAYLVAREYMDFKSPKNSILYMQATNGHCKRDVCKKDGVEILAALRAWRESYYAMKGEKPEPEEVMKLAAQMLETPEIEKRQTPEASSGATASPAKPKILQWKVPGDYPVTFSVQVRGHEDSLLLLENPAISVPSGQSYQVGGLSFVINGKDYPMQNFAQISTQTSGGAWFSSDKPTDFIKTTLTGMVEVVPLSVSEFSTLEIIPKFEVLQPVPESSAPAQCFNLEQFKRDVLPTVEARNCVGCHQAIDLSKPARLCAEMFTYVNPAEPVRSALLDFVLGKKQPIASAAFHPRVIHHPEEVFPYWTNWIDGESEARENSK